MLTVVKVSVVPVIFVPVIFAPVLVFYPRVCYINNLRDRKQQHQSKTPSENNLRSYEKHEAFRNIPHRPHASTLAYRIKLFPKKLSECLDAHATQITLRAFTDSDSPGFFLLVAYDQHVRNFLELRVTNLPA